MPIVDTSSTRGSVIEANYEWHVHSYVLRSTFAEASLAEEDRRGFFFNYVTVAGHAATSCCYHGWLCTTCEQHLSLSACGQHILERMLASAERMGALLREWDELL